MAFGPNAADPQIQNPLAKLQVQDRKGGFLSRFEVHGVLRKMGRSSISGRSLFTAGLRKDCGIVQVLHREQRLDLLWKNESALFAHIGNAIFSLFTHSFVHHWTRQTADRIQPRMPTRRLQHFQS